ncbi:hypothetical protein V5799_013725, partial [Amblyomma americanum]
SFLCRGSPNQERFLAAALSARFSKARVSGVSVAPAASPLRHRRGLCATLGVCTPEEDLLQPASEPEDVCKPTVWKGFRR